MGSDRCRVGVVLIVRTLEMAAVGNRVQAVVVGMLAMECPVIVISVAVVAPVVVLLAVLERSPLAVLLAEVLEVLVVVAVVVGSEDSGISVPPVVTVRIEVVVVVVKNVLVSPRWRSCLSPYSSGHSSDRAADCAQRWRLAARAARTYDSVDRTPAVGAAVRVPVAPLRRRHWHRASDDFVCLPIKTNPMALAT